ncbi:N-formylglutamate amidohydrolase [Hoeflea sp. YIM 152468]|uniref:N-formylglutamate amidohydrolase n=1 Tax=Hoeflea sp. YIM 152468 TaxID=3031759 RepID=UPI0023DA494D|nr:N-formylglutamate amidohydrolase [Hoeflea sp. YIM 152468]MDF1608137.1 N-formylglutamate amidohydrolase [Hoeflea sp. YIM 152468]
MLQIEHILLTLAGARFQMQDDMLIELSEGPAFVVRRPEGASEIVLVCEHASNRMPRSLGSLGLDEAALESHIAWDIGAQRVAENLSDDLDASLVSQRFSRLAYDCNRPPMSPGAYPERSEIYGVPGNAGLSAAEKDRRADALYHPFHHALDTLIDARLGQGRTVVLVTVHSFTPVYFGRPRDGHLGILHDDDGALADAMLAAAAAAQLDLVRRNYPYGPDDGVTHTLQRHGLTRQIANVMLEIRNDLISDETGQRIWAERIADLLRASLAQLKSKGGRLHA